MTQARHPRASLLRPTALVWGTTSDRFSQPNALESQQPPCALVVAPAGQGVAALMVIDLGGQLFQEGPGNQAVVPAGRVLRRDRAMDLRYGPLRVFPPVVAGSLASGTGSSGNSGTDDGSGPDRSGPRNDSGPTPTSGPGSTAPRGG